MPNVELFDLSSGRKKLMATVRVEDGQPVIDGAVPESYRRTIQETYDRQPDRFFPTLVQVFSGRYVRAEMRASRKR